MVEEKKEEEKKKKKKTKKEKKKKKNKKKKKKKRKKMKKMKKKMLGKITKWVVLKPRIDSNIKTLGNKSEKNSGMREWELATNELNGEK